MNFISTELKNIKKHCENKCVKINILIENNAYIF